MKSLRRTKIVEDARLTAGTARTIAAAPQQLTKLYKQIRAAAEDGEPSLVVAEIKNWHVHNALSQEGYDITDVPGKNETVIWWGYS